MSRDQRHFQRVAHDARASLGADGMAWACTIHDVSFKGSLVELQSLWLLEADKVYQLSLHLTPVINIKMDVKLAHQEGLLVGLRCVNIDLDSATELRRLVEFNLGDPKLLERELQALLRR